MSVIVERPKSAMQARRSLLTSMFAFVVDGRGLSMEVFRLKRKKNETYPFQISVDHAEVVHVLQAICNAGQLNAARSTNNVQVWCGLYVDPAG